LLFDAEPSTTVALLADIAALPANWGRELDESEVLKQLANCGVKPRKLANDPRSSLRISELSDTFLEAYVDRAQGDSFVPRSQSAKLLSAVLEGERQLCIVAGPAGNGKSGVLYQLAVALRQEGVPFLGFRLDDQPIEVASSKAYGDSHALGESPAFVLGATHPTRPSVLIIDQLDALRWRTSNSERAFEVVKEMLAEVHNFKNLRVVIACRSFDLDNDPLFRQWKEKEKYVRIDVNELDEEQLRSELTPGEWEALNPQQRALLRQVLNLHIWRQLGREAAAHLAFTTSFDLMRAFWVDRIDRITRAPTYGRVAMDALSIIARSLRESGDIGIPLSRIPVALAKGIDLLQSLGVLRRHDRRVLFTHQSYGDYLVVETVLRELLVAPAPEAFILDWLGDRTKQTLHQRGQTQLLLQSLADANREALLPVVRHLLASSAVRFHIKLLALQVLGEVSTPTIEEQQYATQLLDSTFWQKHLLRETLDGKRAWIGAPEPSALIRRWLFEGTPQQSNMAAWLLRSVKQSLSLLVDECMLECERRGGDLLKVVDHMLLYDQDESDTMFELRLRAVKHGRWRYHHDWKRLVTSHPSRFLRLAGAWLECSCQRALSLLAAGENIWSLSDRENEFGPVSADDLARFCEAAEAHPDLTWQCFVVPIDQFFRRLNELKRRMDKRSRQRLKYSVPPLIGKWHHIEAMCVVVGRMQARSNLLEFLAIADALGRRRSRLMSRIVFGSLMGARRRDANWIVGWVASNLNSAPCGAYSGRRRWKPARHVLRRFGAACSGATFRSLETAIRLWKRPVELTSVRIRHDYDIPYKRLPPNRIGEAAYFMLSALPLARLSTAARGDLWSLRSKFSKCGDGVFGARERGRGGRVQSSISTERARHFSDRTWIRIITANGADRTKKKYHRTSVRESSAEAFASNLGWAAERNPQRFTALGCKLPTSVADAYIEQLWWTVGSAKPRAELSADEKASWQPATVDDLQRFYWHVESRGLRMVSVGLCRTIRERPADDWNDRTLRRLSRLCADDSSPSSEELTFVEDWSKASIENLETTAINHVRPLAASAVAAILIGDPTLLPQFKDAIDHLVVDPHPSVRIAAVETLGSIWNVDKRSAVDLFSKLCDNVDDRVLASRSVVNLLNHMQEAFADAMHPIVERMLASPVPETRRHGAARVALQRWHYNRWGEKYKAIRQLADESIKKGIVHVLDDLLTNHGQPEDAVEEFVGYFDDPDKGIRNEAERIFAPWTAKSHAFLCNLAVRFIGTQAFVDDPNSLLFSLSETTEQVVDIAEPAFRVCEAVKNLSDRSPEGGPIPLHADLLTRVLLRVYQACEITGNTELRDRCLDSWDLLLESGAGTVQAMLKQITND